MNVLIFLILTILIPFQCFPQITWDKTYNKVFSGTHSAKAVFETPDAGYLIAGYLNGNSGSAWLIKLDSFGDSLWSKEYNYGLNYGNPIRSITQTPDNHFVFVGDVGNGLGVTKVNLHREIIWSKNYYNGYATSANDIKHTNDGEYIIIGEFSGAGYKQLMLFKINFEGDSLWSKTYGDNDGNHYLASSVQETQDGGFIIAGEIYTDHNVLWIVRTDSIGDTLWTKSYDRSGYRSVYAQTIKSTKNSDEYIILSNSYKSKHLYLDYDIWMLKINSMGDTIWTKTFGGDKSDFG